MKFNKKTLVISFLIGIMVFTSGVFAGAGSEDIKASLNHMLKIKVNGVDFVPKDTDGSILAPITYKGRNYLPVIALSEALKVPVEFDSKTNTVLLGKIVKDPENLGQKTKLGDLYSSQRYSTSSTYIQLARDKEALTMYGKTYSHGLISKEVTNNQYMIHSLKFNLDGKYTKLTFKAGLIGEGKNVNMRILDYSVNKDDGIDITSKVLTQKEGMEEFEIDVTGIKVLGVGVSDPANKGQKDYKLLIAEPVLQ